MNEVSDRNALLALLRRHSYREGEFVLASGRTSNYYVDVRRTSLTAKGATLIGRMLLSLVRDWPIDAAGGMTLGADPLTTAMSIAAYADNTDLTGFIVRKEAKDHGAGRQIEVAGDLEPGAAVLVLDDTVTTGGSTLRAVEAMRAGGYHVVGAACVVDRLEGGSDLLAAADVPLRALFTLDDLRGAE